jgi:IS1 family transposase
VDQATNILGSDIANKLAELGPTFNTNPGFGLDGVIKGNEMRALANEGTPATPQTKAPQTPSEDKVFAEVIDPLNTSIQATKQELRQSLGQINTTLAELKSGQMQDVPPEDVDPATSEIRTLRTEMAQVRLNNAYDRARNSLNNFKAKNPDFDWSEQNIQELWQSRIGNNVNVAETTDWDSYFKMNHDAKRAVKQDQMIEELKGKVATLESRRNSVNDLASVPRSSNAISTATPYPDSDFNEELYARASARMGKGRFMGYGRILQEEQQKMQLAGKI